MPGEIVRHAVGWLEESPGVKSSTRLFAAILLGMAGVLVATVVGYVWFCITRTPPIVLSGPVIGSLAACLTAIVGQGAVAISKRYKGGSDDET